MCAYSIPAEMIDAVSSKDARAGGIFRFRTSAAMTLDRGAPLPKGTPGYGIVRSADPAGRHDHDGSLALEPRYLLVPAPHGAEQRLEVTMNPTLPVVWSPREPLLQKAASRVPLPVPGMVISAVNAVRWGRNITLGPGFAFSVLPIDNLARGPVC